MFLSFRKQEIMSWQNITEEFIHSNNIYPDLLIMFFSPSSQNVKLFNIQWPRKQKAIFPCKWHNNNTQKWGNETK